MILHACSPSYSGGWGRRITWTQEADVAVSQDCAIVLQPGQQELNSFLEKKQETKKQQQNKQTNKKHVFSGGHPHLSLDRNLN